MRYSGTAGFLSFGTKLFEHREANGALAICIVGLLKALNRSNPADVSLWVSPDNGAVGIAEARFCANRVSFIIRNQRARCAGKFTLAFFHADASQVAIVHPLDFQELIDAGELIGSVEQIQHDDFVL